MILQVFLAFQCFYDIMECCVLWQLCKRLVNCELFSFSTIKLYRVGAYFWITYRRSNKAKKAKTKFYLWLRWGSSRTLPKKLTATYNSAVFIHIYHRKKFEGIKEKKILVILYVIIWFYLLKFVFHCKTLVPTEVQT